MTETTPPTSQTSATLPMPVAIVMFDPFATEGREMSVRLSKAAVGFLATLSDFELRVFAAEAGLRVRKALEMPPSPIRP